MSYHVGDLVRITGTWTNAAGTATDPTAVFAQYRSPSNTTTTLTYGVDAALVKGSTGVYYVDINASAAGQWFYRFYSTGTGQASNEEFFNVPRSEFS
jgi:hypothetical protein